MTPFFIVIAGPTGVGKTDFALQLAKKLSFPVELINADMGQLYTPLSIGTAKPDYQHETLVHHLFDRLDEPRDYTVHEFRQSVVQLMQDMWARGVVPLIVGGSSFYVQSLFFPPLAAAEQINVDERSTEQLWSELNMYDPERAEQIHPHDRYRIVRALALWYSGTVPSKQAPVFDPPGRCFFYYLIRERAELYGRINKRVRLMFDAGWLEEVQHLDPSWRTFLRRKKLIGYPEIIEYLETGTLTFEQLVDEISTKTRAYAKRQITYWRMLEKKLLAADPGRRVLSAVAELNLTGSHDEVYIKQLVRELEEQKDIDGTGLI